MIDQGVLRDDADPEKLSLAMLAALQGGLLLAQAQRSAAALEAALDVMIEGIRHHAVLPTTSTPGEMQEGHLR